MSHDSLWLESVELRWNSSSKFGRGAFRAAETSRVFHSFAFFVKVRHLESGGERRRTTGWTGTGGAEAKRTKAREPIQNCSNFLVSLLFKSWTIVQGQTAEDL